MTFPLAPYFHPTTAVFVDDNENFLRSLDLELPSNWAYRVFADTDDALAFLNRPPQLPPLVDRCFTVERQVGEHATVSLDLGLIEQEINHKNRFARNSVLMIDYSMPLINGLEFCAELTDPDLQIAMLTGVADEKVAVQAFNARLIDRFIPKNTNNSVSDLIAFVEELQYAYFAQYTARLIKTLTIDPPAFLTDPDVARALHRLMEREQVIEYYMVSDPGGYLMLRADGSSLKTLICESVDLTNMQTHARDHNAPQDIQQALDTGKVLLTYADALDDFQYGDYPWSENIVPAERIPAVREWYIGVQYDPPSDIDFDPASASYDSYLASLDDNRSE